MNDALTRPRLIGLDILRLLAFLSIVTFHASWIFWPQWPGQAADTLVFPTALWRGIFVYMRIGAFSGFTILLLTSFLFGWRGEHSRKQHWLFIYLFFGWLMFNGLLAVHEGTSYQWVWDIYPLIGVGFYSITPYLRRQTASRYDWLLLLFAFLVMSTPFWYLQPFLRDTPWLQEFLVGRCPIDYADWPLLPWLGLIWFACLLGAMVRQRHWDTAQGLQRFHLIEAPVWMVVGLGFYFSFADYYTGDTGDRWACHTFRQEWRTFLSHLGVMLFAMRLSFHQRVRHALQANPVARYISRLAVNKHFFLAYLWHYVLLFIVGWSGQATLLMNEAWFADGAILFCLVATELGTRAIVSVLKRRRKRFLQ